MRFSFDSNGTPVPVRDGDPIGGVFTPGSVSTDTWHRLMPHGDASKVEGERKQLNIGVLRADITGADIANWQLYLLNAGYQANYRIKSYDAPSEILTAEATNYEQVDFSNLPDTVKFVIRPYLILPFTLYNRATSTNIVRLGYSPANTSDGVIELSEVAPGKCFVLSVSNVHKIFYKYASVDASDALEWGEHFTT